MTSPYAVRVSASSSATQIVAAAAPTGWIQTATFPTSLIWKPSGGGAIPLGAPLPGTFSIDILNNAPTDKQVVIEWLSVHATVLCRQTLSVPCVTDATSGTNTNANTTRALQGTPPSEGEDGSAYCRCMAAETEADGTSEEYAEPDLSVDLGNPVAAGFLKVTVPYTIEVEPAQLPFTRHWDVTVLDSLGNEGAITVPISDNLAGQATFTLPGPGEYNFYLTVTDQMACVAPAFVDRDENSDVDTATYRTDEDASNIGFENASTCDPKAYRFGDTAGGVNQSWSVNIVNSDGTETVVVSGLPASSDGYFYYTFPSLNQTYRVYLDCDDPSTGSARPQVHQDVTPAPFAVAVKFDVTYSSCTSSNFSVQFRNASALPFCNATWTWDFGDGTAVGTGIEPVHVYALQGTYHVTATAADPASSQTLQATIAIVVEQWQPDVTANVCPNGQVIYATTAPCNMRWFQCQRTWDFPDGNFTHSHQHDDTVKVCYDTPGIKIAHLTALNDNGAQCVGEIRINIPSIVHCCPHDHKTTDVPFSYKGRDYRLRTKFRYHGSFLRSIFMKTKLQRFNGVFWERKRAGTISVAFSGQVMIQGSTGCYELGQPVGTSKSRNHLAKVSKWNYPQVGGFCVQEGALTAVHFVQIDNSDSTSTKTSTTTLWVNDCGCE